MAISYISSTTVNATSITSMPTHAANDLLVMWAYRTGSTAAATIPSGWTSIGSGSGGGGSSNSYVLAWKTAASSAETSGTWTNATLLSLSVFRGQLISSPIGAFTASTGLSSGTAIAIPALTLSSGDGSSWVAGFFGHRSNLTAPTASASGDSLTRRSTLGTASGTAAAYDTNGAVASYAGSSLTISATSSNYIPAAVEILAQPDTRYYVIT